MCVYIQGCILGAKWVFCDTVHLDIDEYDVILTCRSLIPKIPNPKKKRNILHTPKSERKKPSTAFNVSKAASNRFV